MDLSINKRFRVLRYKGEFDSSKLFHIFFYFIFFQELIGVIVYRLGGGPLTAIVPTIKYAVIGCLFLFKFKKIFKDRQFYYVLYLFGALIVFAFVLSDVIPEIKDIFIKAATCFMIFFIGKYAVNVDADRLLARLTMLAVLTGFADYFLVYWINHESVYKALNIGAYFSEIKQMATIEGLPGNLYGNFSYGYFSVRRLGGAFFVPLGFSYFSLLLLFYNIEKKKYLWSFFLIVLITLTFTRAILIPMYSICIVLLLRRIPIIMRTVIIVTIFIVISAVIINHSDQIITLYNSYIMDSSGKVHFRNIIQSIEQISLVNFNNTPFVLLEGVYWPFAYSMGLLSVALILLLLFSFHRYAQKRPYLLFTWLSFLFTTVISIQIFSPTTSLLFWFLLGAENSWQNHLFCKQAVFSNGMNTYHSVELGHT